MTSKERFRAAMNYTTPDRPPMTPLHAPVYVWDKLFSYYKVQNREEFQLKVGEDFRYILPRYIGPELKVFDDGRYEGIWGEIYKPVSFGNGWYDEPCYLPFAEIDSVEEAKKVRIPSPDWYDYSEMSAHCDKYSDYITIAGNMGHFDFINGTAFTRGVEQVLLDIATENPVYLYLIEKRYEFYYEQIRRILEACEGKIDVVYVGEDLGSQNGPIISPKTFEKLFAPKYEEAFKMIHKYGAKTMMHSCGSVRAFIPILIDIGLDILDVVQVDAANMSIESLHSEYYKKIVFSGTLSVQKLLNKGTPEDIWREIELRKELFKEGGIIIGPTNNMQIDMPMENFDAMCRAIGTIK